MYSLIEQILNPPKEFTAVPFWFFDDEFDCERVRNQLKDFCAKGVHAFVLHPRIGIPESMEYLSDEYFDAVKYIVDTAAELDMHVVLYDEGMYPSGSAHGEVVKFDPSFASVGITLRDDDSKGKVLARLSNGKYLVEDFSGGTIRGIHFGEDDGEAGAPASADILNPAAVDKFIELTHDQYYKHLKKYFGNVVIGFFTDEPCVLGRNAGAFRAWTPGLEEAFAANGGRLEDLGALFENRENESTRIYHDTVKKRLMDVFYTKLSSWCEAHGIAFMGHPETSDDLDEEMFFHIPGQDLIMRRVSPEHGAISGLDSVQAKCSADVARLKGRRRNSNECFGVCNRNNIPWYMTAGDMKWFIDWLGIRGVNLFIPHAFYYSVAGERKGERPPDVGPHNIWWPYFSQFADYMRRLSWLMTDNETTAKTAVVCRSNAMPVDEVAWFYQNQTEFMYLPAAMLDECTIDGGKLCINNLTFDYVYNLAGAEYDEKLKGAALISDASEAGQRDFELSRPCKDLRVSHFIKEGVHMYLLFLEQGEEDVTETLKINAKPSGASVEVDLWTGEASRLDDKLTVTLKPGQTRLIIVGLPLDAELPGKAEKGSHIGDFTEKFQLKTSSHNVKEYEAQCDMQSVRGDEYITFTGDELAECWCNGEFAGADFFREHSFRLGAYLREGTNTIRVRMTGNAANIYENADIPFGIF